MYEDNTIEDKYLHNFSLSETVKLRRIKAQRETLLAFQRRHFDQALATNSAEIMVEFDGHRHDALEIKYILNRIAANDPRDWSLDLTTGDDVGKADRLALDIAKAFHNNTHCERVIVAGIGLTDNGMIPLLRALSKKELSCVNISGNKITDKSLEVLDAILSNPETKWKHVGLGEIRITPQRAESLKKHPNTDVTFEQKTLKAAALRFARGARDAMEASLVGNERSCEQTFDRLLGRDDSEYKGAFTDNAKTFINSWFWMHHHRS